MFKAFLLAASTFAIALAPVARADEHGPAPASAGNSLLSPAAPGTTAPGATAPIASGKSGPLADRPADLPPALKFMVDKGVKLTAMGNQGGVRGYLAEEPGGRMQPVYVTPDGEYLVVGILVRAGGVNETGLQLGELKARWDNARRQVDMEFGRLGGKTDPATQDAAPAAAPAPTPATPSPLSSTTPAVKQSAPAVPTATAPATTAPAATASKPAADSAMVLLPMSIPATTSPAAPAAERAQDVQQENSPAPGLAATAVSYASPFDKAKFLAEVGRVAWFNVGADSATSVVYMVADPQCPFCHDAWSHLLPLVQKGKIRVNVILIGVLTERGIHSEPLAISLLARPDPGLAWMAGEGSVDGFPVAPPPPVASKEYQEAKRYLDLNTQFAKKLWPKDGKNHGTPVLAYVGHDGKLYSTEGSAYMNEFLAAL